MASAAVLDVTSTLRNFHIHLPPLQHARTPLVITTAVLLLLPIPFLPRLYRSYRHFISLGPGGVPYNIFGFLLVTALHPFTRETRSTVVYSQKAAIEGGKWGEESFLKAQLPERKGSRPEIGKAAIPQRQITECSDGEMRQLLSTYLTSVQQLHPNLLTIAPSKLETRHSALYLNDSFKPPFPALARTNGEIAHVHAFNDGTMHAVLSARDAQTVVERGWGERHPFSGSYKLPWGYTFVYAPRDAVEAKFVKEILGAAVAFAKKGVDGAANE